MSHRLPIKIDATSNGVGWRLDDPRIDLPFIEQARALGVRNIAIHKGLPFPDLPLKFATCDDVGPAARRFPDMNFGGSAPTSRISSNRPPITGLARAPISMPSWAAPGAS